MKDRALGEFLSVTKALSDRSRVRALMAVAGGELCVCQIIDLLRLAPSTVSRHMAILYQAGLVEARKDGRWVYFRLADDAALPRVRQALAMTRDCVGQDDQIREDARALDDMRRAGLEGPCRP